MANYKKMVNGVEIELTDDEQKEREAEERHGMMQHQQELLKV